MSRLTSKWTDTAEQAFGASGAKGRRGELLVKKLLADHGVDIFDNESDRDTQVAGVDLFTPKYSIDVKANLNAGVFYIETSFGGWLFNPNKTSDIIIHVDVATNEVIWYRRDEARKAIRCSNDPLLRIYPSRYKSWMNHHIHNLAYHLDPTDKIENNISF